MFCELLFSEITFPRVALCPISFTVSISCNLDQNWFTSGVQFNFFEFQFARRKLLLPFMSVYVIVFLNPYLSPYLLCAETLFLVGGRVGWQALFFNSV